MKWPPCEFWQSTPYDCLLAAGGMAKASGVKRQMNKQEIDNIQRLMEEDKLRNGNG